MKIRLLKVFLFFFTSLVISCAGYHFNTNNNPLIGYDIKSISVPMFINRTNIPALNTYMTKEIVFVLNEFSGLKITSGENENADAVLLGILESEDQYNKTFKDSETLFTDRDIKESIGNRPPFYYGSKTTYKFQVRYVLIKRPSNSEIELLTSELGKNIKVHPKIVLDETLDVSGNFSRAISPNVNASDGGQVNFVKNKGLLIKSLQDISISAAKDFKQVVLNAF